MRCFALKGRRRAVKWALAKCTENFWNQPRREGVFGSGTMSGHVLTHAVNKPFECTQNGCSKSYCDQRSLRRHLEKDHSVLVVDANELKKRKVFHPIYRVQRIGHGCPSLSNPTKFDPFNQIDVAHITYTPKLAGYFDPKMQSVKNEADIEEQGDCDQMVHSSTRYIPLGKDFENQAVLGRDSEVILDHAIMTDHIVHSTEFNNDQEFQVSHCPIQSNESTFNAPPAHLSYLRVQTEPNISENLVADNSNFRRTQSVRPYHSLEINSVEDLSSPILPAEQNKYRSASVDECKLRSREVTVDDDLLNFVDEYITKDLKQMEVEKIERESYRKMTSSSSSSSSNLSPKTNSSWLDNRSNSRGPHQISPIAMESSSSSAPLYHSSSNMQHSSSQFQMSIRKPLNVATSPGSTSPSRFSFNTSQISPQQNMKTFDYTVIPSPRPYSAGGNMASLSPMYHRQTQLAFGGIVQRGDCSSSCMATPKSADSVFTFDVPPQTPPVVIKREVVRPNNQQMQQQQHLRINEQLSFNPDISMKEELPPPGTAKKDVTFYCGHSSGSRSSLALEEAQTQDPNTHYSQEQLHTNTESMFSLSPAEREQIEGAENSSLHLSGSRSGFSGVESGTSKKPQRSASDHSHSRPPVFKVPQQPQVFPSRDAVINNQSIKRKYKPPSLKIDSHFHANHSSSLPLHGSAGGGVYQSWLKSPRLDVSFGGSHASNRSPLAASNSSPSSEKSTRKVTGSGAPLSASSILESHSRCSLGLSGTIPTSTIPYTPPPMLFPLRKGSGLFASHFGSATIASKPLKRSSVSGSFSLEDNSSKDILEPVINVGPEFQAEIPARFPAGTVETVKDRSTQLWSSSTSKLFSTSELEYYFELSQSCAINGGGSNLELAHHLLSLYRNMKPALRVLLRRKTRLVEANCPFVDYPYQNSTKWTYAERVQFNRAWHKHGKDFFLIANEVKSKTVKQIVEYYYNWKVLCPNEVSDASVMDNLEYQEEDEETELQLHQPQHLFHDHQMEEFRDSSDFYVSTNNNENVCKKRRLSRSMEVDLMSGVTASLSFDDPKLGIWSDSDSSRGGEGHHEGVSRWASSIESLDHSRTSKVAGVAAGYVDGRDPLFTAAESQGIAGKRMAIGETPIGDVSAVGGGVTSNQKQPAADCTYFPCKLCGKIFYKVKSRNAHMKSHSLKVLAEREANAVMRSGAAAGTSSNPAASSNNFDSSSFQGSSRFAENNEDTNASSFSSSANKGSAMMQPHSLNSVKSSLHHVGAQLSMQNSNRLNPLQDNNTGSLSVVVDSNNVTAMQMGATPLSLGGHQKQSPKQVNAEAVINSNNTPVHIRVPVQSRSSVIPPAVSSPQTSFCSFIPSSQSSPPLSQQLLNAAAMPVYHHLHPLQANSAQPIQGLHLMSGSARGGAISSASMSEDHHRMMSKNKLISSASGQAPSNTFLHHLKSSQQQSPHLG